MRREVAWCGGLLLAAGLLALSVLAGSTASLDRALLFRLAPPPRLVPLVEAVTWLGDSATRLVLAAAAAAVLLALRDRRRAAALILAVACGAALNSGLKQLMMRPRPDLLQHLDHVTSNSFPSGHAANGAILYLSLAWLVPERHRRAAITLAAAIVVAIGLSRVALAVHWPSDVAAGWCVGIGWVLLWRRLLLPPQPVDPA